MSTDTAEKKHFAGAFFWPLIGVVVAAMFFIEHDMKASIIFQTLMSATSIDQLDTEGVMFEQSSGRQIGGLALGALGVLLIVQHRSRGRAISTALGGWMLLFFAWALLSVSWAEDPSLTARRLVLFGCMGIGGWALATRLSPREIAALALSGSLVFLLIGIYAEYANGTLSLSTPGYRFSGTVHPNSQAINCALLFFSSFYFVRSTPRRRWFFVAVLLFALVMLYLTRSRTALASVFVSLAVFEGLLYTGPKRMAVLLGGTAAVIAVFLISDALLPAVQGQLTLGRTDVSENFGTLTGRWPLWTQLTGFIAQRPLLGYGYGGFWNYDNSMAVIQEQGWPISHAHNAYIDVMLELGPVGCIAFIIALLTGLRTTYLARITSGDRGYEFLGLILAFGILNSFLESQIVQRTFLMLLVIMALAHLACRARATAGQPKAIAAPQHPNLLGQMQPEGR